MLTFTVLFVGVIAAVALGLALTLDRRIEDIEKREKRADERLTFQRGEILALHERARDDRQAIREAINDLSARIAHVEDSNSDVRRAVITHGGDIEEIKAHVGKLPAARTA